MNNTELNVVGDSCYCQSKKSGGGDKFLRSKKPKSFSNVIYISLFTIYYILTIFNDLLKLKILYILFKMQKYIFSMFFRIIINRC